MYMPTALRQSLRAGFLILWHAIPVCSCLLVIWIVERFSHWLWGNELPLVFGSFPLKYIFDLLDLIVVGRLGWLLCSELGKAFRE